MWFTESKHFELATTVMREPQDVLSAPLERSDLRRRPEFGQDCAPHVLEIEVAGEHEPSALHVYN